MPSSIFRLNSGGTRTQAHQFYRAQGYVDDKTQLRYIKELTSNSIEAKLDEADFQAKTDSTRLTHEEVFSSIRGQL